MGLADDSENWPDPVYFPQRVDPDAAKQNPLPLPPVGASAKAKPASKKWGRKRPNPQSLQQAGSDLKDGTPQDPAPSPYPLVRLAMPLKMEGGVVPAGIYLAQPTLGKTQEGVEILTLMLIQRNHVVIQMRLQPAEDNQTDHTRAMGTPSPLQSTDPKIPPVLRVEAVSVPEQNALQFHLRQGNQHFTSAPFPLATDTRNILPF